MNSIVRTDQEVDANARKLARGGEHQLADGRQIPPGEAIHIVSERVRMQRDFGMCVRAEMVCTFQADGAVAKSGALR